ncbi:uncharacterized protein LOC131243942 isoform X2 [Magnolia sinica]|uniref:uncharacterized protein LOC131243942 isoform X2 n=1 Tax=Magnolia sinica TaxID=86752 RepID=UPI002659E0B0|nr:uncharacterized protein LOC131243942 isoform X2 [Magnolia sinica]
MKLKPKQKKSDPAPKLILEEIIGLTTKNASGLVANVSSGDCVYLAGCVVVVYNIESGAQKHLLVSSRMPKPLSCVSVLRRDSGSCIAAGESGPQPAVLIWDYSTQTFLAELKGHRYGVACIDFSPDGKHLVSIGFPNDGYLCLWDWRSGRLVTKLKASTSCSAISSVCFSSDGSSFVTAGKKHLKLWTLGLSTKPRSHAGAGLVTINGKPANIGNQKGSSFTSVTSAAWMPGSVGSNRAVDLYPIYALTDSGVLCLLHSGFSIRKWVDLKVERGFALSVSNKLIACACNNGIVQLFVVETLKHIGNLLYSEPMENNPTTILSCQTKSSVNGIQHVSTLPDAIACQFSTFEKLVVVYGDHSLYVWDVLDVTKVSRCCVLVSHSSCIWDVKNIPFKNLHDSALGCVARGCRAVSFATCSADGTIRLWDLALQSDSETKNAGPEITMNQQPSCSLNTDQVGTIGIVSAGVFAQDTAESGVGAPGFRSMAVSSDGKYLAAGDCHGNLHVYNLYTSDYTCFQEAHDAEILSLSFSSPSKTDISTVQESESHYLLASGGRDQIIHVYDIKRSFDLIGSLDDHSAAVTSVKLTCNGRNILSCSADRSILFRDVAITDGGYNISRRHHQVASHGTVYDMAIDPAMEVAVTVGQDKKINMFNLASGKLVRTFKQDPDFGEPIKVTIDPSGSYLVCSYSNRSFSIHDSTNGELITRAMGHAEVITGVIFLPDCKHIITVGGDSCIFVWKMPALLSTTILQKIMENASYLFPVSSTQSAAPSEGIVHEEVNHPNTDFKDISALQNCNLDVEGVVTGGACEGTSAFKFSISRLPKWAQIKVTSNETSDGDPEFNLSQQVKLETPFSIAGHGQASATMVPIAVRIPCQLNLGNSQVCHTNTSESPFNMDATQSSPMDQGIPSFNVDGHWRTIHTVYLDLLDSPEVRDVKDVKLPISIPNLIEDPLLDRPGCGEGREIALGDLPATDHILLQPHCGLGGEAINEEKGCTSTAGQGSGEQLCSEASEIPAQTTKDDESSGRQHEDDDLFSQHFSNLSTLLKVEGRRSSARRSFSSRFVVRRDQLTGCKSLFEMTAENLGAEDLNCCDEAAHQSSQGDPSNDLLKDPQISDICDLGADKSGSSSGSTDNHEESDSTNGTARCYMKNTTYSERITECRAALLSLDTAAEKALQLFTDLRFPVAREDVLSGPATELSDLASELVPSITRKVQELADLVHSSKMNSSLDARVEAVEFEPLIGKFAESLSRQVLELVKNNI